MNSYYVTTPIYYVNGKPHLGNTYTTVLADLLTRYHRWLGADSFMLTGTDEHGAKVAETAANAGKSPKEFTDEISAMFRSEWDSLGLQYSRFIRTTEPQHVALVQQILQQVFDSGDIYFGQYGGHYCFGCERFLTEKELVDGKCPDHQTVPTWTEEQNYFFKMTKYRDQLIAHIEQNPDFIRPTRYRNEVLSILRDSLEDLCISRPKSKLTWGITLPFDDNFVCYVWFDALINYLTGIDFPTGGDFKRFWDNSEHLIAKDIVKPHGVYWPTMLMAAGIPLFKHLTVHGYWNTPSGKMSKSLGNVVHPKEVVAEYGLDALRYYFFREMSFGLDGVFSMETLHLRYNADLANNLGNLVSRSLAMAIKYRDGEVPTVMHHGELENELQNQIVSTTEEFKRLMANREIHRALESIWGLIDSVNVYIDRTKPWILAKDTAKSAELDSSLYHQLESIRIIASLISPFMPTTAEKILTSLGFAKPEEQLLETKIKFGGLPHGVTVVTSETLFPRKEGKKDMEQPETATPEEKVKVQKAPVAEASGVLSYDEFMKTQLRVGEIVSAEAVAKSEKLLKLTVNLGAADPTRQIVAGIAKSYTPESLIGRRVVVVANLKPAKLMGIESRGMILAASDETGKLELINPGTEIAPGGEVR